MSTVVIANQPTDLEHNLQLVEQFVEVFWNYADAADRFLSPAYVDHAYQPGSSNIHA